MRVYNGSHLYYMHEHKLPGYLLDIQMINEQLVNKLQITNRAYKNG